MLTADTRHAMTLGQVEVVAMGAPSICEDPDCERPHTTSTDAPQVHPTETKPGDWVLIRHRALSETHQDGLYVCQQDAVLAILIA